MGAKETEISQRLRLAASARGAVLFRNHAGLSWQGETVRDWRAPDGTRYITLKNPRPSKHGLTKGASDLIGWTKRDGAALFTAVEVKTTRGRATAKQKLFCEAVRAAGGIAGIARGVEDLEAILSGE